MPGHLGASNAESQCVERGPWPPARQVGSFPKGVYCEAYSEVSNSEGSRQGLCWSLDLTFLNFIVGFGSRELGFLPNRVRWQGWRLRGDRAVYN